MCIPVRLIFPVKNNLAATAKGKPTVELYDHRTDPHEKTNIASQHPELVAKLLPELRKHAATWPGLKIP